MVYFINVLLFDYQILGGTFEMSIVENKLRERLLLAINKENLENIERLLSLPGLGKISESCMAAAERTENDEIVGCVLDHIINNGLDVDHDFPTQIHWALARGFKLAAVSLATIITDEDLLATDSKGMTPLELAQKLHNYDVVDLLEDRS